MTEFHHEIHGVQLPSTEVIMGFTSQEEREAFEAWWFGQTTHSNFAEGKSRFRAWMGPTLGHAHLRRETKWFPLRSHESVIVFAKEDGWIQFEGWWKADGAPAFAAFCASCAHCGHSAEDHAHGQQRSCGNGFGDCSCLAYEPRL